MNIKKLHQISQDEQKMLALVLIAWVYLNAYVYRIYRLVYTL